MSDKKQFETEAIRQQIPRSTHGEHTSAMYVTSSFVFDDAEDMRASFAEEKENNIYSRYSNPNTTEFIDKVVSMEGAESGYAFASGMAAIFSYLRRPVEQWRSYSFGKVSFWIYARLVYKVSS